MSGDLERFGDVREHVRVPTAIACAMIAAIVARGTPALPRGREAS